MKFTHLHNHTTYSFGDGFGTNEQILSRAKELGYSAYAKTDHGHTGGNVDFYVKANKLDVKPLLGCELYVCDSIDQKDSKRWHLTAIAKDSEGYKNLNSMLTVAWNQGFYYKPRVDWNMVKIYQSGIVFLTGCFKSVLYDRIEMLDFFKDSVEDWYYEIVTYKDDEYIKKVKKVYNQVVSRGFKTVVTCDTHYINDADYVMQDIVNTIGHRENYHNPNRMKLSRQFHMKSPQEVKDNLMTDFGFCSSEAVSMMENTQAVADSVKFEFPKQVSMKFKIDGKSVEKTMDLLLTKVNEGIKDRKMKLDEVYKARLNYELKLIRDKGFIDYFLIISDIVKWAKHNGILCGFARGSAAGSLVCYVIGITEVDPIRHKLVFERFIDVTRSDLPDIDLDFEDRKRDNILEYIKQKYIHCGSLSTWCKYKGRLCLLDVARVFNIPLEEVYKVTKLVIQRSGGDSRASFTVEDTFKEFDEAAALMKKYPDFVYAARLEQQIRQKSRHAAGVLIAEKDIEYFAHYYDDGSVSIDGDEAKAIGVLKIDILGLNTLSKIKDTIDLVEKRHGKSIDIYNLNLNDKQTIEGFWTNKFSGIFQFEGDATKHVTKQFNVRNFEDIVIANALSRPGTLHCGGTTMYLTRFNGQADVDYVHEKLEKITKDTLGVVIFQEQVMAIVRDIGDFDWKDTSTIRKIMSDSQGKEIFNKLHQKFLAGAMNKNLTEEEANAIWLNIVTFGSWAFNKSHSVSYALLAYVCMFLKVNYKLEFFASNMAMEDDEHKKIILAKEFRNMGCKIILPTMNLSKAKTSILGNDLVCGWNEIKGIGDKEAKLLEDGLITKLKKSTIKTLEMLGIMQSNQLELFSQQVATVDIKKACQEFIPVCHEFDLSKLRPKDCLTIDKIDTADTNSGRKETKVVGVVRELNLRDLNEISRSKGTTDFKPMEEGKCKFVNILIEDEFDTLLVTVNARTFPRYKNMLFNECGVGGIIEVEGLLIPNIRKVFAKTIKLVGHISSI